MINTSNLSVSQEFDALSFELEQEQNYQNAQSRYIEYEVDSVEEEFGELFRVWNKQTLVGTFYRISEGWKATPFYSCRQYNPLLSDSENSTTIKK